MLQLALHWYNFATICAPKLAFPAGWGENLLNHSLNFASRILLKESIMTNAELIVLFCCQARPEWVVTVLLTLIFDLHLEFSEEVDSLETICRCGESPCGPMFWQTSDNTYAIVTRPTSLSNGIEWLEGAAYVIDVRTFVLFFESAAETRAMLFLMLLFLLLLFFAQIYKFAITCTYFEETFDVKFFFTILARNKRIIITRNLKALST